MTCAEVKALMKRHPEDVTRAERYGVGMHYRACDICRARMLERLRTKGISIEALAYGFARRALDKQDPETP